MKPEMVIIAVLLAGSISSPITRDPESGRISVQPFLY